jgi:hypothetical protein
MRTICSGVCLFFIESPSPSAHLGPLDSHSIWISFRGAAQLQLDQYIDPQTPTEKKELVNIFVLIAGGVVAFLTALVAVGNLYLSRRSLQQQRNLGEQGAQDEALQTYYEQMAELLTDHDLANAKSGDQVRFLARAHTMILLRRLDAPRLRDLVLFLNAANLLNKDNPLVSLDGADLQRVDLSKVSLRNADLSGVNLQHANLRNTELSDTNLAGALLHGADLEDTKLDGANLESTIVAEAQNATESQLYEGVWSGIHAPKLPRYIKRRPGVEDHLEPEFSQETLSRRSRW